MSWTERLRGFQGLCCGVWSLTLAGLHWLRPFLVIAMVSLFLFALFWPKPFSFSINAETEHVTLSFAAHQQVLWRIDGAQLCTRTEIEAPPYPVLESAISPCSGGRWQGYNLANLNGTIHELTLRFPTSGSIVRLDAAEDGALLVQIHPQPKAACQLDEKQHGEQRRRRGRNLQPRAVNQQCEKPGQLSLIATGAREPHFIGTEAILRFLRPGDDSLPSRMVLPFSGSGSIGKDVSWRESAILRKGSIHLYTHSEETVGGRALVASTELLPGDRIDLNHGADDHAEITKGFIHYDLLPELAEPRAMRVVAFGTARSIEIIRFGDKGYTFAPGLISRLMHHSAVTTWAVGILSILTLMAIYSEAAGIGQEARSRHQGGVNLRRYWRQFWRGDV